MIQQMLLTGYLFNLPISKFVLETLRNNSFIFLDLCWPFLDPQKETFPNVNKVQCWGEGYPTIQKLSCHNILGHRMTECWNGKYLNQSLYSKINIIPHTDVKLWFLRWWVIKKNLTGRINSFTKHINIAWWSVIPPRETSRKKVLPHRCAVG